MAVTGTPDGFISDVESVTPSHPSRKKVFIIILKVTKTNFIKGGGEEKLKETF